MDNVCTLAPGFYVSSKGGTGGGGWGHPQGDMHMVSARLDCQSAMVGTRWANSCPGCMDRLRKCYSHLVGGSFQAWKAAWTLSGCLTTKSADYRMLVNEWAWLSLASFPGLPRFSSSVCVQYNTWKRKRALSLPCIILSANRRAKTGEAWERGYMLVNEWVWFGYVVNSKILSGYLPCI